MHGNMGGVVNLDSVGGLVTLAGPSNVPEGASPRTYNFDYDVGGVHTRAGLKSVYEIMEESIGPLSPSAVSTNLWSNPSFLESSSGFASYSFASTSGSTTSSGASGSNTGSGVTWTDPNNIGSASPASVSLGTSTPVQYSGDPEFVRLVLPQNTSNTLFSPIGGGLPSVVAPGACTLNANISSSINITQGGGSAVYEYSLDGGTTWSSFYSTSFSGTHNASIPLTISGNLNQVCVRCEATGASGPSGTVDIVANILEWNITVTSSTGSSSCVLAAVPILAAIPSSAVITGITVNVDSSATSTSTLHAQLTVGGVNKGSAKTATPSGGTITFGPDLWGTTWTPANFSTLGVAISATSAGTSVVQVDMLQVIVAYTLPPTSNSVTATNFGISLGTNFSIPGIGLTFTAYCSGSAQLQVQLTSNGVLLGTPKTVPLGTLITPYTIGGQMDGWNAGLIAAQANSTSFGVVFTAIALSGTPIVYLQDVQMDLFILSANGNMQCVNTFTRQNGNIINVYLDNQGNLWTADVTNTPTTLALTWENITQNSLATYANSPDVEYLAFYKGGSGSDLPLKYSDNGISRITQVGPGAAPVFTPSVASENTFAITSITQPAAKSDITNPGHLSVVLWSSGPGSTSPGNVITVYYSPSFYDGAAQPGAEDKVLDDAFNSGIPVYVYITGTTFANGTYQVTSIGNALPPGVDHFRYYFTIQVATSAYQKIVEDTGQYQMTLATMTTSVPVPGLDVGNTATVSGATPSGWNNEWPIVQDLNSGSMVITSTNVSAGVATYSYALSGGVAPVAGELVTVTGTTNANGALNVSNATIVSASGGATGTFTLTVGVADTVSSPENGAATTAGTEFYIDPGPKAVGTSDNPIIGNTSVGGSLTYASATAQLIGPGTRQGSVFFITTEGYWTRPAPPVTFTCPENTEAILASQIAIGPPNVIARGIILTDAGQNGVPGGNFFTIPNPVTYIVNNQSYTASAFIINDNTTTNVKLNFTDDVLLNAEAVDIYGFNLFNQIEIGNPGWITKYDDRLAVGLCQNTVKNFNNLSFDGGYLTIGQDGQIFPLGWSNPDIYGTLIQSAKFGNAYYVQNTSDGTLSVAGMIQQSAYQDWELSPILYPNTAYSVRVTAAIPSGITDGNLNISLVSGGDVIASYVLPFYQMSTSYLTYSGPLLTNKFVTVPNDLVLQVSVTDMGVGADIELDRIEIFNTDIPVDTTSVYFSYAGLYEQFDEVSGIVKFEDENQQPVNGATVLYDTFYALKGWYGTQPGSSMYSLQASANLEPADWNAPEVAQKAGGAIGPLAFDGGEQWFVAASRAGLYLFQGGQPGKIMEEIYQIWDAINWTAGDQIWVKVDNTARKIYVGVPLPTPNFWLPNAPMNANPTTPNVILMCNYQGIDSGEMLKNEPQMHTTMFGSLNSIDMRRKWNLWLMPSPGSAVMGTPTDQQFYVGNGLQNGKVYQLDPTQETDDGIAIDSLYTTAGLPELMKRSQYPFLGKMGNTRATFMWASLESLGRIQARLLPNNLFYPEPAGYKTWTVPGGFLPGSPALYDSKCPLNFSATRTYIELRENDGHGFTLSNLSIQMERDQWGSLGSGSKGGQTP